MPAVKQLKDIIRITSGGTPSKKKPEYWDGDIPWISAKSMKGDTISDSSIHITHEGLIHGSRIAPKGSILLLVRGSGLFNDVPICYVDRDVAFNQDVKCLESLYPETIPNKYIFYWLKSQKHRLFRSVGVTTIGAGKFDTDFILNLEIPIPVLDVMKRQIGFMDALSSKLICNEKINQNLAEQIRTLCNAWLIDYEPFGGKRPDNWEITQLSSLAEFTSGYSYKGNELQPSSVAMATIKNFDRNGGFKLDGYKEIVPSSKLKAEHHAELFDTLVAHTDLTQNADVIGNAEPILSLSGYDDIVYSMDLVKVTPKNPYISKYLIAAILQAQSFKAHCLGYVNGTTVLHMSKKALPEYSLMLPSDLSVLKPLDEAVTSMYKQMAAQIDESMKLQRLRDTLLPKLMSGKLDVSEVEL